jgi:hypothetical protein
MRHGYASTAHTIANNRKYEQMNESEIIRLAMSILGKRTSERKKESCRANARRPRKRKRAHAISGPEMSSQ